MTSKNHLLGEFLLLFVALPPTIAAMKPHGWMYVMLWVFALLAWRWMVHHDYRFNIDWNKTIFTKAFIYSVLRLLLPIAIALTIFTIVAIPERLFSLPLQRPFVWVMVMVLYPLLSVIPQEIIFRSFFFRRYAALFQTSGSMIIASALAFGWVHLLLLNWVAVVFSVFGGLIFARTYSKTRSLAAVCFEHALYGCVIFTLGLGYYFYHGQAVR